DRVEEHAAVRRQQPIYLLEERRVALLPEMLERPDADDPIHRFVEFLPPLEADFDPVAKVGEPLTGKGRLVLTEGQPDGPDAVILNRPTDDRPPAAPDVQKPVPGLQVAFP